MIETVELSGATTTELVEDSAITVLAEADSEILTAVSAVSTIAQPIELVSRLELE